MFALLADENFTHAVIRGLLRREPAANIVRVQDVGLSGANDVTILEWAARHNRVLLTHDSNTMTRYAYDRLRESRPMAGLIEVSLSASPGEVIEELLLLLECTTAEEWRDQVRFLPM